MTTNICPAESRASEDFILQMVECMRPEGHAGDHYDEVLGIFWDTREAREWASGSPWHSDVPAT